MGLGSAVMLSEKNALFPQVWLKTYSSFRSKGHDHFWAEHSVAVPYNLAHKIPKLKSKIHIEPASSFFRCHYGSKDLEKMFIKVENPKNVYCHHLWQTFSFHKYLKHITLKSIKTEDTTYNLIARKFI